MKIGILTLPLIGNYGGVLQAYALQKILNNMGHEACLIERRNSKAEKILKLWLNGVSFLFMRLRGRKIAFTLNNKKCDSKKLYIDRFINTYINYKYVRSYLNLNEKDFDAFIVGSDQIWRPIYCNGKYNKFKIFNYYLFFTRNWNIKRLSYAASFGTDKWEYTKIQTWISKKLIKKFDAVSVREKNGVDLCKKYFDTDAQWVLDPTMLLTRDDYISLFQSHNTPKSKGSLLVYILDETSEKTQLIDKIEASLSLIPFYVNKANNKTDTNVLPSIEQWLRGFYDAKFVITDSFHACVFSILFMKPFIVYGNKSRGLSRFTSLLNMFGLNDRLVTDLKDLNKCDFKI